ncbi:MAG: sigma-54-dependent Fis family transcriptional regulator [Candidatus Manganitrophaceae bacterium]|nr:MAG: sigma-54-dependent Fis family transcriptional regulator [Candidatus Manganitrophaceae bacterium]
MRRGETASPRILAVDDDLIAGQLLVEILSDEGYRVESAAGGREAVEQLEREFYDLIITDLKMPGWDGLEVLRRYREQSPETLVILVTAFGSMESAIEAMKAGAFDYVSKPFREDEIKIVVRRALDQRRLKRENEQYRQEFARSYGLDQIIGHSRPMTEIYKTVAMITGRNSTVLIQGESGTGKELIAQAIHHNGPRAARPFVVVNCAALPEPLLESEMFGHVRGAFTGAVASKKGLFEEAEGGTLFLDEIGEMGLSLQAKLLRALQEREVRRVGANDPIRVDVRIIAATNQSLDVKVKEGRFREDLLYRLRVVTIALPPLRERREDIPLLADYFLKQYAAETQKTDLTFSPQAIEVMCRYEWPGNVRELQHAIEQAVVLTTGRVILAEDLPLSLRDAVPGDALPSFPLMSLDELQRRYLIRVLREIQNRSEAARILGVDRRTLYRMAQRYGIPLTEERGEESSPPEHP